MPPKKEEQEQIIRNRSQMIGAAQGPFNLGSGASIPAFPSNFSNINPSPSAPLIPFRGGGTAEMSVGGAQVNYPSRLGLAGGNYGPREMGVREFGPAALPQAQPITMLEQQYTNPFRTPAERFGQSLTLGLTPIAPTQSLPIESGPLAMNVNVPQTPEQRGMTRIQNPYGSVYATSEQLANMMAPRTLEQQSSLPTRPQEEQQALLAQMRERGAAIRRDIANRNIRPTQEATNRYYAFRENIARGEAQEALSTERGRTPQVARGAKALAEAERFKQAQAGVSPMSRSGLVYGTPRPSTAGPSTMTVGGSPFSFTQFAQTAQRQPSFPTSTFMGMANNTAPQNVFRPIPFRSRQFRTV